MKNWFNNLTKAKKIAVCSAAVLLVIVLAGGIILATKLSKINTEDISGEIEINEDLLTNEGYTNVALFGIDSRSGELEKGTRTDCLIVASLNNETKEVKMVSVYRDTILDIEENYLQKCNAAYAFGGPTQAINMLNRNLDLDIQEYATVDFAAIANAIDLLGGLDIEVKPEEVKTLNKYVKETARVAGKTANTIDGPGLHHLDGVQATTYARIRSTAGGDFTRTERQRLVIEKIVEKAQQSDLATINKIIDEILPTIKTSFTPTEILAYAKDFMKYKIVESSGFPFEKTTATISGLGSIVIPVTLEENVKQLHELLYEDEMYTPSATVSGISAAIVARVGERKATDYDTLSKQTYVDTEEDKAQEHNEYAPPTKEEEEMDKNPPEDQNKNDDKEDVTEPEKPSTKPDKDEMESTPAPDEENESDNTQESVPDTGDDEPSEEPPEVVPDDGNESDKEENSPEIDSGGSTEDQTSTETNETAEE